MGSWWGEKGGVDRAPQRADLAHLLFLCLGQPWLASETHLQVKGNADHKMPENRQECANQVFLEGRVTEQT